MPLYDYACPRCEHTFEALVFDDAEAVECPQCHDREVRRQLSVPAKPLTQPAPLPSACNSSGPPCGPMCGRFRG
jgi:putative FmdB family regulatory protein